MQKPISSQYSLIDLLVNDTTVAMKTKLPKDICEGIIKQYSNKELKDAVVQQYPRDSIEGKERSDPENRKTEIHWIDQKEWVAGMISYYVEHINDLYFRYDLTAISGGQFQFSVYRDGAHYNWHTDESRNLRYVAEKQETVRKLSFSLQLSDPDDYEGGDLVFKNITSEKDYEMVQTREQGSLIIFDSRQIHKVTPVTSGVRYALVGWYVGPAWR